MVRAFDTALRLARRLRTDEEFWLNLQNRYDLDVARNRSGAEIAALCNGFHQGSIAARQVNQGLPATARSQ